MPLAQNVGPSTYPVSLATMKTHMRVSTTSEDALIQGYIAAATEIIEKDLQRSIMPQTWKLFIDRFPGSPFYSHYHGDMLETVFLQRFSRPNDVYAIRLPKPPVVSVEAVKYLDTDGNQQTLVANTDYIVDIYSARPRILPAYQKFWPSTREQINAVEIDYTSGYATVPFPIVQAVMLSVAGWYENRESAASNLNLQELPDPLSVKHLIGPYIIRRL